MYTGKSYCIERNWGVREYYAKFSFYIKRESQVMK